MTAPRFSPRQHPEGGHLAAPAPSAPVPAENADAAQASASARAPAAPPAAARPQSAPSAPPGPPPAEEVVRRDPAAQAHWRTRRHRGLSRLRVGWHTAPDAELDRVQLTGWSVGLSLGRDQAGGPVPLTLFGPRPARVVLLGGLWCAQLVVFRSLGFGARAVVFTGRFGAWRHLGQWATGRTDRVAVLPPGSPLGTGASADVPLLRVDDLGEGEGADGTEPVDVPWETRLVVRRRLTPGGVGELQAADVVLTQRLTADEASAFASARGLSARDVHALQLLQDDMLALQTGAGIRYVWTNPSGAEHTALGRPGLR
ncbi:hypothetical protein [Prauserella cavernicola]|uniref:Uncharacterized protein n=1 Tax=Prauserella cavernicola TaxID=2800127 RepID=A0A934V3B4_9PSEU|nr:hypothetical protein [Prauserella cavernicola]MBK1783474.1 hypothetical protein [Prauserella cavernicola]